MHFSRWILNWPLWARVLQWPSTLAARIVTTLIPCRWKNAHKGTITADDGTSQNKVEVPENLNPEPPTTIPTYVLASKGDFIASGASGIIERLPSGNVVKSPWPGSGAANCRKEITLESLIYERLGPHPRLVPIVDWDPANYVLTMEYMPNGTLKDYLIANNDTVSPSQRIQWAAEAAEGLQLLHDARVVHSDVEPKNFLLDSNLGLKIADFSGSSLDGSRAAACVGKRFSPPDLDWRRPPTVYDDLFGLGSTIYFIMTGKFPFTELSSDEVEDRYRAHVFPNVTGIHCGSIIMQCWNSEVATSYQVYHLIHKLHAGEV